MAIWKEPTPNKNDSSAQPQTNGARPDIGAAVAPAPVMADAPHRSNGHVAKESLIGADLTIEGKIEGSGHVRMAGHFKGDVNVDGNLTIEAGAKVTGSVRAKTVIIGGELEGNIEAAVRVELLETGVLNGDLKAGSLVVAGGSRMRGQVSFGWDDNISSHRLESRLNSSASKSGMETAAAS
jgi:cytoskeletal protein CcmA (bactofilin family)